MLHLLRYFLRYLDFVYKAKASYSLHSPFAFWLYTEVLSCKKTYYAFDRIENLRNKLRRKKEKIKLTDHGAGSSVTQAKERTISSLAATSAVTEKKGRLLFYLIHAFKPVTALELGTSLGIGTLYQAEASRQTTFYTLEGSPELCKRAQKHLRNAGLSHIHLIEGNIDETLPDLLSSISRLDYVFFDANHTREATLRYFNACAEKAGSDAVFALDDIHWSAGMEQAWEEIKQHASVTMTVDLFFLGLVFFRKKQPGLHYKLVF